jgi:hypothetical protein
MQLGMQLVQTDFLGERKKARACNPCWKECPFLLAAFIPLLNAKGYLDVGPRLSLSPF